MQEHTLLDYKPTIINITELEPAFVSGLGISLYTPRMLSKAHTSPGLRV